MRNIHAKSPFMPGVYKRRARLAFASICILGLALLIAGLGFYLWGPDDISTDDIPVAEETNPEDFAGPELPAEAWLPEDEENIFKGTIPSGATAGVLLQEWLEMEEVNSFIGACKDVFALNKLRAGQPFSVTHDKEGIARFEYEIDENKLLIVNRDASKAFSATVEPILYNVVLVKVNGTIESSLFSAMSDLGETPVLAVRLAEIFAWEINFIRDIQPGDTFSVLAEKRFRDGEFAGYGKVLAADFTNKGKLFEAYAFQDSFGKDQYYNAEGESLKRAFLKAPLSFTRISSRFTMSRMHPILKTTRAHPAVDYAAPAGTPVKAVGDATVLFVGHGTGAGNYITLKHHGGYETMYLHLSRFAKGLKKGQRVSQGEVIGYVGSTGYSTGPHLDFRMKKNGSWVNPESALSPRAEPLNKDRKAKFKINRDEFRRYMAGEKDTEFYSREEFFQ